MYLAKVLLGIVVVIVAGCASAPESREDFLLRDVPPEQRDMFRDFLNSKPGEFTDKFAGCHRGCPTGEPVPPVPVRVGRGQPQPPFACPIWQAATVTPDSHTFAAAHWGVPVITGRHPGSVMATDMQEVEQRLLEAKACRWDSEGALEKRLLKREEVPEVRSLSGSLYERRPEDDLQVSGSYWVPHGYWKVLSVETEAGLRTAAFILDSRDTPSDICAHQVSIDQIEARTGLDLFPSAGDDGFEATLGDLATLLGCDAS